MVKNAKEFINENFERHDYEIDPASDALQQTNYIHKDGSYRVADPAEIAEQYATEVIRPYREEVLRVNAWKAQIERQLAEAVKAIELEKQARTVDRDKISELRKQVKESEAALQRIADDAGQLAELDNQFKALRREDALAVHTKLKETLNRQLDEAVKATELEKPVSVTHRLRVADIKKRLKGVSELLKKMSDEG